MSYLLSDETKHSLWTGGSKIRSSKRPLLLTTGFVLVVVLAGLLMAMTGSAAAQSADSVVASDGSGDYTSIQNAVDNAADTDRIKVRSGTYYETISIDKNITLITTEGATIAKDPTVSGSFAVQISTTAEPEIAGFMFGNWQRAISANPVSGNSMGGWIVRNVTIEDTNTGVSGFRSSGDWTIKNSTIVNVEDGIAASQSTGDWKIENTVIANASDDGVDVPSSSGEWQIQNVIIDNITEEGVTVDETTGDWQIRNTTITGVNETGIEFTDSTNDHTIRDTTISSVEYGIEGYGSNGDWTIQNVTIIDAESKGISIDESTGQWTIASSRIDNVSGDGIDAYQTDDGIISDVIISNISDENGINIIDTNGSLIINQSTIVNVSGTGIHGDQGNDTSSVALKHVTVRYTNESGIDASETAADWDIKDTVVSDTGEDAVEFYKSSGDWTISDSIIENSASHGVGGFNQQHGSNATVENITITNTTRHGVEFYNSSGDWTIENSTVSNNGWSGIEGSNSTGDWVINTTTIENAEDFLVGARRANGTWQIHDSNLQTADIAVNATGAIEGNVSYNYWGAADGPSGEFCGSGGEIVGNATMYPYYTDSSLTDLSSATTSGEVEITDSCLIPDDIGSSNEQTLTLAVAQMSADGETDVISITMPEDVSVDSVNNPQAVGVPYEVNVTNDGSPVTLEVDPDEPAETVDFVIRVPMELSSRGG